MEQNDDEKARKFFDWVLWDPHFNNCFDVEDRKAIEQARENGEDYLGLSFALGYKVWEVGVDHNGEMQYKFGKTIGQGNDTKKERNETLQHIKMAIHEEMIESPKDFDIHGFIASVVGDALIKREGTGKCIPEAAINAFTDTCLRAYAEVQAELSGAN